MRLGDPATGDSLDLRVVAYEFPDLVGEEYDSDWLVIEGSVTSGDRSWTFREPCLLVGEAEALGRWLTERDAAAIDFIEPLLEFSIDGSGDDLVLRVSLGAEAVEAGTDPFERVNLRIAATPAEIAAAADDWQGRLNGFPARGIA